MRGRLAERHDLDHLTTEHAIGLPLVHRRGRIAVYDPRDEARMARRGSPADGN